MFVLVKVLVGVLVLVGVKVLVGVGDTIGVFVRVGVTVGVAEGGPEAAGINSKASPPPPDQSVPLRV